MSRVKGPQEKKALTYKKDRRNSFGEHNKGSRKNIPLARARDHRAARRVVRQVLWGSPGSISTARADELQTEATTRWVPRFHKAADMPLGRFIAIQKELRARGRRHQQPGPVLMVKG